MIGLGNWKAELSSKYVNGPVTFSIEEKDGEYVIDINLPEKFKMVKFQILDIKEVGDNCLTGQAKISMPPMPRPFNVDASFQFDGDTVEGLLDFGKAGKVKVVNGEKIG